ncbi:unnamed protein product [Dibothriocephalus latus]|uniref:Uncharacterized protein n=1 Tax=Dibothriocephalus latus TaxID=60516 RepID=A0A3P6TPU5_DIBLA|nr:unnamed protein product [Dibothriocephalus latus]
MGKAPEPPPSSHEDNDLLGETSEELQQALQYRDDVITAGGLDSKDKWAPATLDGASLLFSRYALRNTPLIRLWDCIFLELVPCPLFLIPFYCTVGSNFPSSIAASPSKDSESTFMKCDEGRLANYVRSLRSMTGGIAILSGSAASLLCIPGIFNSFTKSNQLTVWQTPEMAKVLFHLGVIGLRNYVAGFFVRESVSRYSRKCQSREVLEKN